MLTDWYAHYYHDNPKAEDEVEDDDFNLADELAKLEAEAEAEDDAIGDDELPANPQDWENVSAQ